MSNSKRSDLDSLEVVAGNGLINRRALLGRGITLAGATTAGAGATFTSAGAEPLPVDPWSLTIGSTIPAYETPAKYEKHVVRTLTNPNNEPRTSQGRTPHHLLNGTITPASSLPDRPSPRRDRSPRCSAFRRISPIPIRTSVGVKSGVKKPRSTCASAWASSIAARSAASASRE